MAATRHRMMPRRRRGAGRRPLGTSACPPPGLLTPACRAAVPAARLACRGVHALNYFFSPARRVSASDAVSADVAGTADGRVHGSHRAEPRAMRCHVAASASYGPWKRRATSSRLLDAGRGCDLRRSAPPGFARRRRGGAGWHRTGRVAGKTLSLEPKYQKKNQKIKSREVHRAHEP